MQNENISGQEQEEIGEQEQAPQAESSSQTEKDNQDKDTRFKEGEPLTFVRVRFPGNARSFPFLIGKRTFTYGQKVLAMSDRGMTVGYINSFPYQLNFNKSMLPVKSISKVATEEDIEEQKSYLEKERDAEKVCLRLVEKYKLEMNITHVEFIQFGKKAVFYFNAPARVDFRELVKDLVGELKMRIELRQISVRDRTAAIGGIGVCGLQTCCSSFLKNYGNVSIKMAKNQNLALIPSKLNGICGQIKCCIRYEDNVYSEKRNFLPKENTFVQAKNGDIGKVLRLHLIVEQFDMLTDRGKRRRYSMREYDKKNSRPPDDWKFPERFDHIVDETSNVIGLNIVEQKQAEEFLSNHFKESNLSEGDSVSEKQDSPEASAGPEDSPKTESESESESKPKADETKKEQNNNGNRNRNRNRRNRNNNRNRNKNRSEGENNSNRTNRNNNRRKGKRGPNNKDDGGSSNKPNRGE